ncbi:MAG: DNA-binding LytR/AlgR family response regulator [Saprospiraceae bacterium]|jgi:DNA-binding LytR/AlgR family response regulator
MKKIKVLLVDDEYLGLQLLETFVKKVPELELVAKTKSPLAALDIINRSTIDLLFLDIQMPTLSGVNLLKKLKNPPLTIFTTAYSDYALAAYDLNVVDYLLKSFSFERFLQAVDKAKTQLYNHRTQAVAHAVNNKEVPCFLRVKANSKIVKVFFDEILFIEGLKEYVKIVCKKERIVTFERLKNLEAILPANQFLRVHKSYLVNTTKVTSVKGNKLTIGTHLIPISRGKKEMVVKRVF